MSVIENVDKFDCVANRLPLQILRLDDATFFEVTSLNPEDGVYTQVYELDYVASSMDINGVDLYTDAVTGESTLIAGKYDATSGVALICALDSTSSSCFPDTLPLFGALNGMVYEGELDHQPNVGAIIGTNYYYGSKRASHVVKNINTAMPNAETASTSALPASFIAPYYDVTALEESTFGMADENVDGIRDGILANYLLGVSSTGNRGTNLVIHRLDDNGDYDKVAVVPDLNLNWNGVDVVDGASNFGAAFSYYGDGNPRLLFSANAGWGLFELQLPIEIPTECWHDSDGTDSGVFTQCASVSATLLRQASSDATSANDGFNCRLGDLRATNAPTLSGDPHLVGFQGQRFDVIGKPGANYMLLEDDRLQIVVKIDHPSFEHSSAEQIRASGEHKGLYMDEVGAVFLNGGGDVQEVWLKSDYNSSVHGHERHCGWRNVETTNCLRGMTAQVNGKATISIATEMNLGRDATFSVGNMDCPFADRTKACEALHKNSGGYALATLKIPSITLEVGAQFMNNHDLNARTLHHLDLDVSDYRPAGTPGGLLGQTVEVHYDDKGLPIMKGPGVIGGDEDAFMIDGVDASKLADSLYRPMIPLSAAVDGDSVV